MPCYPPVESCKYVGKYFALFQLYLINQYSRWIQLDRKYSLQCNQLINSVSNSKQCQSNKNINIIYVIHDIVMQKALLVKVLLRGVCRRLSIIFDYDCAPDFRSYCYF